MKEFFSKPAVWITLLVVGGVAAWYFYDQKKKSSIAPTPTPPNTPAATDPNETATGQPISPGAIPVLVSNPSNGSMVSAGIYQSPPIQVLPPIA